jgi:hypothetical protein
MFFKLLNPFKQNNLTNTEITKPLMQKIYKSVLVLYTAPVYCGRKVVIDKYSGIVQDMNLWYVKLKSKNRSIFIPTSFIYDKVIETD